MAQDDEYIIYYSYFSKFSSDRPNWKKHGYRKPSNSKTLWNAFASFHKSPTRFLAPLTITIMTLGGVTCLPDFSSGSNICTFKFILSHSIILVSYCPATYDCLAQFVY